MRKLGFIFFVIVFTLTGNGQVKNNEHNQIDFNSILAFSEKPAYQNTILSPDNLFDVPDTNDLDGINFVCIYPDTQVIFPQYKINSVITILPRLELFQVNELLLDLPPPVLSV